MRDDEGAAMSKVADKIMACVHGGSELRELLGHKPDGHVIVENMEDLFGEKWHHKLFSEIARQIRQEESEMRDFCECLNELADAREEVDLFGQAYVPLPLDADGAPIRVGDVLEANRGTVTCIRDAGHGWEIVTDHAYSYNPADLRHYHEPTVKDVLRDFAYCCEEGATEQSIDEIIAEYAAKLRLADDGEEER